jgi:hypothetical protein
LGSIAQVPLRTSHLWRSPTSHQCNSETKWALKEWNCELPQPIEVLLESPESSVCLVDFQQQSQLNPRRSAWPIFGIIGRIVDGIQLCYGEAHFCSALHLATWWRYWPILTCRTFLEDVAGAVAFCHFVMLFNLRSPTTTKWDERMVGMLVQYLGIDDVDQAGGKAVSRQVARTLCK